MSLENSDVTFIELEWDTNFFGVNCAKAILHKPLTLDKWEELQGKFKKYQFVSIINENSDSYNSRLIGENTNAFLVDVNVQFVKEISEVNEPDENITIHNSLKTDEQLLKIADFSFSKFTEDPNLAKRGGDKVYHRWIINSFDRKDKYFALYKNEDGETIGFVLFSFNDSATIVELIAVSKKITRSGIGSSLFNAVEYFSFHQGINQIKVGTQIRNSGAINFYHKVGCKQVGCHQVYHLWNL